MNNNKPKHYSFFILLQAIRQFFNQEHFLEVMTPPMVSNPGMEPHIHPFAVKALGPLSQESGYLHSSPEFHMKELLSLGYQNIFTLCYAFRAEPSSELHRSQFVMLEWYRTDCHYTAIMDDVEKFLLFLALDLKNHGIKVKKSFLQKNLKRITVQQLFQQFLGIDILEYLEKELLLDLIFKNFNTQVPLPPASEWEKLSFEDLYFLLFLNIIEPELKKIDALLIYEYPAPLAALSTLKESDPRVCERFEVYLNGIELCNCYNELRDLSTQKKRFTEQGQLKKELYDYELPEAYILFQALERGIPPSAGIALGVERLLLALSEEQIIPFWQK